MSKQMCRLLSGWFDDLAPAERQFLIRLRARGILAWPDNPTLDGLFSAVAQQLVLDDAAAAVDAAEFDDGMSLLSEPEAFVAPALPPWTAEGEGAALWLHPETLEVTVLPPPLRPAIDWPLADTPDTPEA